MKTHHVRTLSQLFRVLSDETRLRLFVTLQTEGEQYVTQLCKKLRAPQPTISHHLSLLRIHGLVRGRRSGKQVHYSVNPARFERSCDLVA